MTSSPDPTTEPARPGSGAPMRVVALLAVAMLTSVVRPTVQIAVAFLVLATVLGFGRAGTFFVAIVAIWVVTWAPDPDGIWYLERAWAVLTGGWFAALTLRSPGRSFAGRATAAVAGSAAVVAGLLVLRPGSWATLDQAVRDRLFASVDQALGALRRLGESELPAALTEGVYDTVALQATVYPALLGIGSVAGLGVAWWVYRRLAADDAEPLGPLAEFRFNDHLVWLFIGGLVLLLGARGEGLPRLGANATVFMGALYAARGAAVVMFLSGGLSLLGYLFVFLGLILVAPLVLTMALVIGLGDTWIDVRNRIQAPTAGP